MFLLAETIWQQQEETLQSIETWLIVATIGLGIVLLIGLANLESKLSRSNRIGRASHDLLKEILEIMKSRGAVAPPTLPKETAVTKPAPPKPPAPEVYRID